MSSRAFSDCEKTRDVRAPPAVDGDPAVVMLDAQRDPERLAPQIDAAFFVKVERRGVHFFEAFPRGRQKSVRPREVVPRLGGKDIRVDRAEPERILRIVEIDLPSSENGFTVDGDIDDRGAVRDPSRVEGPLITFEKEQTERFARIFYDLRQEFSFRSVPVAREQARQDLKIRSRNVPPRRDRREAELPFGEI